MAGIVLLCFGLLCFSSCTEGGVLSISWSITATLFFCSPHFLRDLILASSPGLVRASQVVQWEKNRPTNAGDAGLIPGWERSPGGENDNLLQYSCLGNPMDRGAWQDTVHGVPKEWDMTEHPHRHALLGTVRP